MSTNLLFQQGIGSDRLLPMVNEDQKPKPKTNKNKMKIDINNATGEIDSEDLTTELSNLVDSSVSSAMDDLDLSDLVYREVRDFDYSDIVSEEVDNIDLGDTVNEILGYYGDFEALFDRVESIENVLQAIAGAIPTDAEKEQREKIADLQIANNDLRRKIDALLKLEDAEDAEDGEQI